MIFLYVLAAIWAAASVGLWSIAAAKGWLGRRLLQRDTSVIAPWGLVDVYLIFAICYFLSPLLFQAAFHAGEVNTSATETTATQEVEPETPDTTVAKPKSSPEETQREMLLGGWLRLFAMVVSIGYLLLRHRTTFGELGLSIKDLARNIRLGVFGTIMLIPPVMILHLIVSQFVDYKHSTIEQMPAVSFAVPLFAAGFAAPIFEEFLFRGVIQGFLQRWGALGNNDFKGILMGRSGNAETEMETSAETVDGREDIYWKYFSMTWPIAVSAGIFALMHLGQGAASIPLFFFACGLGYFFWRTHSLIPCIVIHLILNVWSLIFAAVQLNS